ncbi:hypothetical protein BB560_006607 [Smittium megazygosporum]|uniref:Eukaryotic translation initiation factor 4E n=1 Tax=Smittium megazygosporum TaxID=133381 RepID=A0A2T9Y3B7_9FUNG|nr:hypothetical protein BB560_006607 [Smittium megazygosporum]
MTTLTTAFTDGENFDSFHPLVDEWTVWYDSPSKKVTEQNWMANIKKAADFQTLEDFWSVLNNIPGVNQIPVGANYHVFKNGIKPMWEDPANTKGGRLSVTFNKSAGDTIQNLWFRALAVIVGSDLSIENVCGAVFSNRKVSYRISLWLRNYETKDANVDIA